jgi:DNA-binding transcriptional regulator YiaG
MDAKEFKTGLEVLGWKQMDFALSTGISKVTVSNWLNETTDNKLPQWASNYMRMLLKLHELRQHLTEGILEPPTQLVRELKKDRN